MMNQDKKKMAMLIIKKGKPSEESPKPEESKEESFIDKGDEGKNHGAISAMEDMMSAMSEGKAEDAITAFKYLMELVKMEESDDDSSDSEDES